MKKGTKHNSKTIEKIKNSLKNSESGPSSRKMDIEKELQIIKHYVENASFEEIKTKFGINSGSINRIRKRNGLNVRGLICNKSLIKDYKDKSIIVLIAKFGEEKINSLFNNNEV